MSLSDQDRARLEEEERYRVEVRRRIRQEHQEVLRRERLERMVADRVRTREARSQYGRRLLLWVLAAAGAGFVGAALAVGSGFVFGRYADQGTAPSAESPLSSPQSDRSAQSTDAGVDAPATSPRSSSPREPTPHEPAGRSASSGKLSAPQPPSAEPARPGARKPEVTPSLPPRSGVAPAERVQLMASRLIETLGSERAEEAANANAAMYERGNPNFVYWRSVAAAIRSAKAQEGARRTGS